MTPKDKAKELVEKIAYYHWSEGVCRYEEAKQCALIAVDEVMSALKGYDFYFWQEVKQEIEKL